MEVSEHNPAHSTSGFTSGGVPVPGASWIGGSPAIATRDPLFFSLHCNVDRLWSKWQWMRTRYTITDVNAYDLQGSHAAPAPGVAAPAFTQNGSGQITANRTLGQYADDTMWPWDNVTGGAGTAGRPNIAILTPFPITLGGLLPLNKPTVKSLIDYLAITGTSPSPGLRFGYDDFFPY
jgi:tyrosinase